MRIALARCLDLPEADMDEAPTLAAFERAGHEVTCLNWDDPHAEPASGFDAVVIRATWNYVNRYADFRDWVDDTAKQTRLFNSAADVRWNLHKGYLQTLALKGVPIVPTRLVRAGLSLDLASLASQERWTKLVVKPAIGAGSFLTRVYRAGDEEAQAFLDRYAVAQDMLIQEYMTSVETGGERSLVVIDGELTHAVEKAPRFDDDEESVKAAPVSDEDRAFAANVLGAADFGDLLFARVDVMVDPSGATVLSELELIEPSLFFPFGERGLARLVAGVERRVSR
ncbi:MAG: hypothetical protein AAGI53_01135 [Planctomycetota bacterium]